MPKRRGWGRMPSWSCHSLSIEWELHHWRHLPLLQRGHHQLNNLLDYFSVLFWIAHCDHPLLHSHSWMHLWRRQGWGNNISCLFSSLHQNEVLITCFESICSHPTTQCWHFRQSIYILGVKAFMRRFAKKLFPLFLVVIDTFDTLYNPNWSTKTKPILFFWGRRDRQCQCQCQYKHLQEGGWTRGLVAFSHQTKQCELWKLVKDEKTQYSCRKEMPRIQTLAQRRLERSWAKTSWLSNIICSLWDHF